MLTPSVSLVPSSSFMYITPSSYMNCDSSSVWGVTQCVKCPFPTTIAPKRKEVGGVLKGITCEYPLNTSNTPSSTCQSGLGLHYNSTKQTCEQIIGVNTTGSSVIKF